MSDYIIHNGELYHYGVKGMKWGRRRDARKTYKNAKNKAFSKYEKEINDIEKSYKKGQMLSKKDQDREARAESNYQKEVSKAKSDYTQAKKNIKEEHKQSKNDAAANKKKYRVDTKKVVDGKTYADDLMDSMHGVVVSSLIGTGLYLQGEKRAARIVVSSGTAYAAGTAIGATINRTSKR